MSGTNELSAKDAVIGRRSIRRFLSTPVPDEVMVAILEAAARAPSNMNTQPWLIHVVTDGTRQRLTEAVRRAASASEMCREFRYSPATLKEPYLSRKRKVGFDLYALYGIERNDIDARKDAMLRNYDFFGAPVGIFVTMERHLELGSWLDCGMFMQSIMIVARSYGLETCPQQAWCNFGGVVHKELAIPDDHIILSGMSIGHPDPSAPENTLVSERASVADFVTWHR